MEIIEDLGKTKTKFEDLFTLSRQSFKKTSPKMNFGKLPSVFGDAFGKTMRSLSKKNEEIVQVLNKKKKSEKLLSPVKINPVQIIGIGSKKRSKRGITTKNNPLAPLRNHIDSSIILEREFEKSKLNIPYLINSHISLNEMITLKVFRSNRANGTVKIMFHLPTLKMYAIKEETLGNKDLRKQLKEWISFWQSRFSDSDRHVKIFATFWNSPEGCVSIVEELNMLENIGSLNEKSIKYLARELLTSLAPIHAGGLNYYSAITPSQILIDRNGKIKISPGLSYRVFNQEKSNQYYTKRERLSLYDPTSFFSPNIWAMKKKHMQESANEEIFENQGNDIVLLGLLLLSCSLGSFDIIDFSDNDFFLLKSLFQDSSTATAGCCLLHCINILPEINERIKGSLSLIQEVVRNKRFSKNYSDFLCKTLNFKSNKLNVNIGSLLSHDFISSKESIGLPLSFSELLSVCINNNRSTIPESIYSPGAKQLERVIEAINVVMPNCKNWFMDKSLIPFSKNIWEFNKSNEFFEELSWHFGIDKSEICEKIEKSTNNFSFITKCKAKNT